MKVSMIISEIEERIVQCDKVIEQVRRPASQNSLAEDGRNEALSRTRARRMALWELREWIRSQHREGA